MNTITNVGVNIAEKATLIWNVADMLRGPFKPHEYGLVILPMTVVKRFHDCLLPTHQKVLDTYEKVKTLEVVDGFLTRASGYQFYNTSKFTFDTLISDPEHIETNFRDYLAGFSGNVQDVLSKFDFDNIIKRMVESNTLYLVIKEFNSQKGYLGPDKISAVDCGYVFEDLVRRFNESYGEEAGAHFTSRDIIYLMTDILLCDTQFNGQNITVYDMAMGMFQPRQVRFKMPKAKIETSLILNQALKNMGVRSAFTPAADFKGIAAMGPLVLDQVKQKCYIDISEKGTEAAAVTSAQIRLTSARPEAEPVEMTVDRPYLFIITDKTNGNILFAGKIVNL